MHTNFSGTVTLHSSNFDLAGLIPCCVRKKNYGYFKMPNKSCISNKACYDQTIMQLHYGKVLAPFIKVKVFIFGNKLLWHVMTYFFQPLETNISSRSLGLSDTTVCITIVILQTSTRGFYRSCLKFKEERHCCWQCQSQFVTTLTKSILRT